MRQRCYHSYGSCFSCDSVCDLWLEKADGLLRHGEADGEGWRSNADSGYCRSDLHGASYFACSRRWRVHTSLGYAYGFIHTGTLGTSLIEHRFWTMRGADQLESMEAFFKTS